MVRIFACTRDGELTETEGAAHLRAFWNEKPHRLWVDMEDPTEEDFELLDHLFEFHPVAVRDVRDHCTTPKIIAYGSTNFLVLHRLFYHFEKETCEARDFEVFFSENVIVTVHRAHLSRTFSAVADRIHESPADTLGRDTAYVLILVLEMSLKDYLPVIEDWQGSLEEVEQMVLKGAHDGVIDRILSFRKLAAVLRRSLLPQRDVLHHLYERMKHRHGTEHILPYFRSVNDQMGALLHELDVLRAHAASVFDTYAAVLSLEMTKSSNKLNLVMQRLNVMASIFLPLTFLVGVYGMNFEYIPELKVKWFYFGLWGFMLTLVIVMLTLFRRWRWY
jgi:magnesium transporter